MAASTQMNTFEPASDLIQEEDCDTLLLYLPGFAKEQLRVQLSKSGFLKISGTRPMGGNKWSSFHKDFNVSQNCDTTKISAKFEGGILYVRQPKLIVPAKQEKITTLPSQETPQYKTTEEPKATRNDHEQLNTRKTENDENTPKELPEKSVQGETKSQNEEQKSSRKNDEENIKSEFVENDDVGKVDGHKLAMESLTGKVKKGRKMVNVVLVVLVAFGIGMYVNNLIWCSNSTESKN